MKKAIALILAAGMALLLAACAGQNQNSPVQDGSGGGVSSAPLSQSGGAPEGSSVAGADASGGEEAPAIPVTQLCGYWTFYPAGYPDPNAIPGETVNDSPYELQLHTDGTAQFTEGVRQIGGVGGPGWFGFTYQYTGTYALDGAMLHLKLTGFEGEALNLSLDILSVDGQALTLQWQAAPPPYWDYPYRGMWARGAWDDPACWASSGDDSDDSLRPIGEGAFEGPVTFTSGSWGFFQADGAERVRGVVRPGQFLAAPEGHTTTAELNLRQGPGTEYGCAAQPIPPGTPVRKLATSDGQDWFFIEYYATQLEEASGAVFEYFEYGWVSAAYLAPS